MHAQSSKTYLPTASAALAFVAILVLTAFATLPVQAQTFTVLHAFTWRPDGAAPFGNLVNVHGDLYGTTFSGGTGNPAPGYEGIVFKIYSDGGYAVKYNFTSDTGTGPNGGLIADASGNLYGTAFGDGAFERGTVFKLDAVTGAVTVLYNFCSLPGCPDGASPLSGLVMDSLGNFYGTTYDGGVADQGIVFKIDPSGTETVLHTFSGYDGAKPTYGALVMDSSGNLYGTTKLGAESTAVLYSKWIHQATRPSCTISSAWTGRCL